MRRSVPSSPRPRNLPRASPSRTRLSYGPAFWDNQQRTNRERSLQGHQMATNILMPALSPTMEQGRLAKWLKKEGDAVRSGDVLAEIETDKATMEVEAIDDGTLAKILVPDGTDNVAVNTPIAVIAGDGEDSAPVEARPSPPILQSGSEVDEARHPPIAAQAKASSEPVKSSDLEIP